MAFDDLATKYRSMFAPSFKIMVEGSNIAAANMVIAGRIRRYQPG